ncbi:hypothetical protein A4R35_13130 [Thermogemmatispora tikiterensis]|uniref:DUF488 domain-containing protein n=2 Tax=Thermogemmatispora tikiterensis TaxID=1825093 RepID=A0A328VMW0_9CHLR|nr:hypothetical protein A4R35_13130 [Thermogemmatispora tikiterensis]
MLYRQRLILALAELAEGELAEEEAQLLLMLLCDRVRREQREAPYEFVLRGRRWRSFVLEHDLQTLRLRRYLTPPPRVALLAPVAGSSYLSQLRQEDRRLLSQVWEEGRGLMAERGGVLPLLRWQRQPSALPSLEEGRGEAEESACLFTLGYEGLSLDAYLTLLLSHQVRLLVDVRRHPFSRKFGFARKRLAQALYEVGIAYLHFPALGVPSELRRELESEDAYRALFARYVTDLLPQAKESLEQLAALIAEKRRVALTCFEADPRHCHRAVLATYLCQHGYITVPIVHVTSTMSLSKCKSLASCSRQTLAVLEG